jgi:hypothetical protein
MCSMSLNRHMSKEAEMVMLEFASFMLVQLYMAQLLVPHSICCLCCTTGATNGDARTS